MSKEKIKNPIKSSHLMSVTSGATVGYLFYVAQIRVSQYLAKICRIHSGFPVFSSILGGTIFSAAFMQSTSTMVKVTNLIHSKVDSNSETHKPLFNLQYDTLLGAALVNLGVYKHGFKQQFRTVLPSHIILPGSFSNKYLPLTSINVTKYKKQIIQEIGGKYGCHHCGSKPGKYIADHIPCTKYLSEFSNLNRLHSWYRPFFHLLFDRDVLSTRIHPQVLFPQCRPCSSYQAGYVSKNRSFLKSLRGKDGIIMHKMRFHRYFIFMFPIYLAMDKIHVTITFG